MLSSPLAKMVTVGYCCNCIQYYFLIDVTSFGCIMKRKQNLSKKLQPTMTKEQLSTFINAALDKKMKVSKETAKQLKELCSAAPMPTLDLIKLMRRNKQNSK